jgi:hypothetical protein
MRKLVTAIAVGALAVGLTAAPSALAKKSVKQVKSTVTVSATPTADPTTTATTGVTASGNVKANSSCRKNRIVHLYYVIGGVQGAEVGTAETRSNGDFEATLAPPSPLADGTAQVRAIVEEGLRTKKIKGKKKGALKGKKKGAINKRKFNCLEGTGDSNAFVTRDGNPLTP